MVQGTNLMVSGSESIMRSTSAGTASDLPGATGETHAAEHWYLMRDFLKGTSADGNLQGTWRPA